MPLGVMDGSCNSTSLSIQRVTAQSLYNPLNRTHTTTEWQSGRPRINQAVQTRNTVGTASGPGTVTVLEPQAWGLQVLGTTQGSTRADMATRNLTLRQQDSIAINVRVPNNLHQALMVLTHCAQHAH